MVYSIKHDKEPKVGVDVACTLQAADGGSGCQSVAGEIMVHDPATLFSDARSGVRMAVRRLTPRECERLQGFPDDYTLIPFRGKPAADGPRYRALGNSMAVPVMAWIGKRIQMVEQLGLNRVQK